MPNELRALGLAVAAAVCMDVGFAFLKVRGDKVANRAGGHILTLLAGYARDPLWLLGLFFQPLGYGLYLLALGMAPLNIVQTTMSSGVLIFVLLAVCCWGERLSRLEWRAMGGVVVGMILLGMSLSPNDETSASVEFCCHFRPPNAQ